MAIQDEMYKKIVQEIDTLIQDNRFNLVGKEIKTKQVAKMLTEKTVYSNIVAQTGASTATISRVKRYMENYRQFDIFARLDK